MKAGEFVATRSWLSGTDAQIGDRFQLLTITEEQADEHGFDVTEPAGPTMPATLVGIIDGPSELQDPYPIAVFPAALLDAGDVGVASSVRLVALAGQATIDELRAQLDDLEGGAFGLAPVEWVPDDVRSAVTAQAAAGLVLLVAALAGALTFGAGWSHFVDEPSLFGSTFDLATGAGGEAVPEDLRALLEQDPDVTDAHRSSAVSPGSPWRPGTSSHERVTVSENRLRCPVPRTLRAAENDTDVGCGCPAVDVLCPGQP